jgi:hypothetical protein
MWDVERPQPAPLDEEPMREAMEESKRRVERSQSMLQWLEDLLAGFGKDPKDKPKN